MDLLYFVLGYDPNRMALLVLITVISAIALTRGWIKRKRLEAELKKLGEQPASRSEAFNVPGGIPLQSGAGSISWEDGIGVAKYIAEATQVFSAQRRRRE